MGHPLEFGGGGRFSWCKNNFSTYTKCKKTFLDKRVVYKSPNNLWMTLIKIDEIPFDCEAFIAVCVS